MWSVWLVTCSWALNMKKRYSASASTKRNAKFILYWIGFISKNEEYNPEQNIPNGRYLKNLILQRVVK